MHLRKVFCFFIVLGVTVNAQITINLRGTVSNRAGNPIANAIVTLAKQGLKDTTGSDGAYSITGNTGVVLPLLVPGKETIFLYDGVLAFSLPNPSQVKVEIFDIKGKLLKREVKQNAATGFYRFKIAENSREHASKLLIIKASIGQDQVTLRYFPLHNNNYMVSCFHESSTRVEMNRFIKLAAVNDTLKTTAANHKTQVTAVTSYDQMVNIILDTAGGTVSEGCGKTPPAGGKATIDVDGTQREYILKLPANYDPSKSYRLIFCWHARGGNMDGIANQGYYGLEKLSNNTAIFVSPNGIDNGWANTGGRDIKFLKAMLKYFNSTLCIDQGKIFSTGFSYGGMMSFAIACAMSDVFRAIAPMSGALYSGCDNTSTLPIAMWMAHGTTDNVVPLEDGKKGLDIVLKKNGCGAQTTPVNPSPCVQYQGCKEGYPVIYCEFNGGHAPQSWAQQATWNFFSQF